MTIEEHVAADLQAALRAGETVRRDTLRLLRAAFDNARIAAAAAPAVDADPATVRRDAARDRPLDDAAARALIARQAKQREESITHFRRGNRAELAAREEAELAILRAYLPTPLAPAELAALVDAAIAETGADGVRAMGRVIPLVLARAGGRAEGGAVSAAVRARLGG